MDRFKPIGSPCNKILEQPVTQDVGPNSGRERQRRAYEKCLRGESDEPARPIRRDIALKGRGFLDTVGKFMSFAEKGRKAEAEENDERWRGSILGKVGIPNPMKLFGGSEEEDRFYGTYEDAPSKSRGAYRMAIGRR